MDAEQKLCAHSDILYVSVVAGHFDHEGLRQLHTKLYATDEGLRGQNVLQLVVD